MESKLSMKLPTVFISYAREDKAFALKLFEDLKSHGANPWIDINNLLPGENWQRSITVAIEESDFL